MERLYKIILIFSLIGGFFISLNFISAASNDVVINEIAWMNAQIPSSDVKTSLM